MASTCVVCIAFAFAFIIMFVYNASMICGRVLKRKMFLLKELTRLRSNPRFQNSNPFQGSRIVRLRERVKRRSRGLEVQEESLNIWLA